MIEKIPMPDVIDATAIGSFRYEVLTAINRIIDGLNSLIEDDKCNCFEEMSGGTDCTPRAGWFCPKHGHQTHTMW